MGSALSWHDCDKNTQWHALMHAKNTVKKHNDICDDMLWYYPVSVCCKKLWFLTDSGEGRAWCPNEASRCQTEILAHLHGEASCHECSADLCVLRFLRLTGSILGCVLFEESSVLRKRRPTNFYKQCPGWNPFESSIFARLLNDWTLRLGTSSESLSSSIE